MPESTQKSRTPSPVIAGDRAAGAPEAAILSPTSPLERNPFSARGWKNRDSDGIGLAMVASLSTRISTTPTIVGPPKRSSSGREIPALDFLNSCSLCGKGLHGKDIYMYRGEKAFCSAECREQQIVSDERQEKCRRPTRSRRMSSSCVSSSPPCTAGRLFFTGIATA